jgi:two-component system, NarL family, nitrate/nitrite response regulator NarL
MAEKLQILLLDDHALFRIMLRGLLDSDPDFHVTADCSAIAEALEALAHTRIDLALLDYDLGENENGFQFIRQARETGFAGRMILVTAGMSERDYVRSLGLGISGIVLKHSSPELLIEAIRKVAAGETWLDPRCVQALEQAVDTKAPMSARRNEPTERELQVLKGVFEGLSNKEIGARLSVSEASVKSALQQLFLKTGVRTRSQLVRVALEEYGSLWRSRG